MNRDVLLNENFHWSSFGYDRSNEVWVLDLEQWSWSKPPISGPSPHPRGGQSQVRLQYLNRDA